MVFTSCNYKSNAWDLFYLFNFLKIDMFPLGMFSICNFYLCNFKVNGMHLLSVSEETFSFAFLLFCCAPDTPSANDSGVRSG